MPDSVSVWQWALGTDMVQQRSAAGDTSDFTDMQRRQTLEKLNTMADSEK